MENRAEFERVYGEHAMPLRRLLCLLVRDPSAAEDLTHETFLHFWQWRTRFDPARASLRAYLFGVARKKAAEWRRRKADRGETTDQSVVAAAGERVLITDLMSRLPTELSEILWLREVEGYSYLELADVLRIPVGTVRSRLHSAREQLRLIWKEKERL